MPKSSARYSRFNIRYLASRYAGATFMFLAFGLFAGLGYRLLLQPVSYTSHADVPVSVTPFQASASFDWQKKSDEWRLWLNDQRDKGLLSVNLRYALKLADTENSELHDIDLSRTLAEFNDGVEYSTSFFGNRYLQRLSPLVTVRKTDLARFMDFQSLAAIVADTIPSQGVKNWDFTFFKKALPETIGSGVIVDPDRDDLFFQVFYTLHEFLHNRPASSPHAAWKSAVEEITARIDRESSYPGGGGFGSAAQRELIREIQAIPTLAANGLYHVNSLFSGEDRFPDASTVWGDNWARDTFITLLHHGRGSGLASANATVQLKPTGFPRDIPQTHIAPLVTATLLNFVAAREGLSAPNSTTAETTAVIPPTTVSQGGGSDLIAELEELPVAQTQTTNPEPLEPEPVEYVVADPPAGEAASFSDSAAYADTVPSGALISTPLQTEPPEDFFPPVATHYVEMYDEVAAKQQQSLITMHEEAIKLANVERDASIRQLNNARAASNRLSHEAITARNRADKLRERYDSMAAESERSSQPQVPPQTLELFQKRDELLQRLFSLREYCTEEHPFVKLALRDLRVVEQMLGDHAPDATANRDAEARATRLANLYLEWETAISQADSFEERARQHDETIQCMLDEIVNLERCISQREFELAQAKEVKIPIVRVVSPIQPTILPPAEIPAQPQLIPNVAEAVEIAEPTPLSPSRGESGPRLVFAKLPSSIGIMRRVPDWRALWWGLLGGGALALLWMILRELFADRFRNVGEAHRLTGMQVLASLPAYDQLSVQSAAETLKGELFSTRPGRHQFMPMPVEAFEPPPEGRRGKIEAARKRRRWMTWALGLLFLALAGLMLYRAASGYILPLPRTAGHGEFSLPSTTVPAWARDNALPTTTTTWGNQP